MTVLLGLIIVGLTACSGDPRMNPDRIIDEKSFNAAMLECDDSWRCARREVFAPKIEKHCSQNKLTSAQCADLTYKVELKASDYLEKHSEMLRGLTDKLKEATEELKDEKRQQERRAK